MQISSPIRTYLSPPLRNDDDDILRNLVERYGTGNGKDVIEKARADKPADYLRIVASLVPKELNLNSPGLEDMGDDEIL